MTGEELELNVFGSMRVLLDGNLVSVGGATPRRALALLVIHQSRTVSISQLIDTVWGDEQPDTAAHQIRKTISKLRSKIPGGKTLIETDGTGYRLSPQGYRSDVAYFQKAVRSAADIGTPGHEPDLAALKTAIDSWAPFLGDEGVGVLADLSETYRSQCTALAEKYFELMLDQGHHSDIVAALGQWTRREPWTETFRRQLMIALYRLGRSADALQEYESFRSQLADELGIDPSPAVQDVFQAVLTDSPTLKTPTSSGSQPASATNAGEPTAAAPSEPSWGVSNLPRAIPGFVGREDLLEELVTTGETRQGAVAVVSGLGGVGKTALATQVAHRLAEHFPDGQLYVDLETFKPKSDGLDVNTILDAFFRLLDVPPVQIPDRVLEKVHLWRKLTSQRRVLVFLDDVKDAAQVDDLALTGGHCCTLVTSRARLTDITADIEIDLSGLTEESAVELLRKASGRTFTDEDRAAAAVIVDAAAGLPVALRVTGGRLRRQRNITVAALADEVSAGGQGVTDVSMGRKKLTDTLLPSWQALPAELQETLTKLANFPVADALTTQTSAIWLGVDDHAGQVLLEQLVDVYFVQETQLNKFILHDVVRQMVLMQTPLTSDQITAAKERLLLYLAHTATEALTTLGFFLDTIIDLPESPGTKITFASSAQAAQWFSTHARLIENVTKPPYGASAAIAFVLLREFAMYCSTHRPLSHRVTISAQAVAAADASGNPEMAFRALANLGLAETTAGHPHKGIQHLEQAAEQATDAAPSHHVLSLYLLAYARSVVGEFAESLACSARALAIINDVAGTDQAIPEQTHSDVLFGRLVIFDYQNDMTALAAGVQELDEAAARLGNDVVFDGTTLPTVFQFKARLLLAEGRPQAAREMLAVGREQSADVVGRDLDTEYAAVEAMVLIACGDAAAALTLVEQVARTLVDSAEVLAFPVTNYVGFLYFVLGRHDEAYEWFSSARHQAMAESQRYHLAVALEGLALVQSEKITTAQRAECAAEADSLYQQCHVDPFWATLSPWVTPGTVSELP